jgi:cytochrome P450
MLDTFRQALLDQQRATAPGPRSNLLELMFASNSDPIKPFMDMQRQYGDIVRIDALGTVAHLLVHPEAIKYVLQDNNRNYPKSQTYEQLKQLLGNGLVTSEGDFWLRQRRLAQPAFHRQRIAGFAETMTSATERMLERWQPFAERGTPLDVASEMMALTMTIIAQTMFSTDVSADTAVVGRDVGEALRSFDKLINAKVKLPEWVPTPTRLRFQRAKATVDALVDRMIEERRRSGEDRGDLLSMLMLARDSETGEAMSDQQLRDEVMTIFLAGHETTSNALSWTFYLLSKHPTVERRLRTELATVLGGRTPTLHDLPQLPYTLMVIEESMRLYPPVWGIERRSLTDDRIGGYHIPAGSYIFLMQYVTHRHPDFWDNPEGFDPERFSPERATERPRFAYFPFGGGPRQCIGNNFALMEAQLILATVLQRYQLELVPGHPIEPESNITLSPRYGVQMTLHDPSA